MKKYLLVAALVGAVALLVKKLMSGRDDWTNLTEDEARQRLRDRFPDRMPDDTKEVVTDKIVSKMKEKGAIIDLTQDEPSDIDLDTVAAANDATTNDAVTTTP
jgi:hypothetical protein